MSALIFLSSLAQLNLANTLPRFLPRAGRSAARLILYSYGASAVTSVLAGAAFVTILPRLSPQWQFLGHSAPLAVLFAATVVVWGVFALEDAALTGLQRAVVVPVENTAYGVLKLLLLAGAASLLPATGIFVSWVLPLVVVIPVINWLIFRRYLKSQSPYLTDPAVGVRPAPSRGHTLRLYRLLRYSLRPGLREPAAAAGLVRAGGGSERQLLCRLHDGLGTWPGCR